jgi:hypothetical protein
VSHQKPPGAQPSLFSFAWLLDGKTGGGLHALKVETGEELRAHDNASLFVSIWLCSEARRGRFAWG